MNPSKVALRFLAVVCFAGLYASAAPTSGLEAPYCDPSLGTQTIPDAYCNKYWICVDGNAIEQTCPEGLYWNQEELTCDYEANVDTSECLTSATEAPETTAASICEASGYYYVPAERCDQFYACDDGTPFERTCPAGLYWNEEVGNCDYEANVDTSSCVEPTEAPVETTEEAATEGDEEDTTEEGTTEDDSTEEDTTVEATTEDDSTEDDSTEEATTEEDSTEPDTTEAEATEAATTEAATTKAATTKAATTAAATTEEAGEPVCDPSRDYRAPDPSDCYSYYECEDGEATRETCIFGLVYNAKLGICWLRSATDTSNCQL